MCTKVGTLGVHAPVVKGGYPGSVPIRAHQRVHKGGYLPRFPQ